MVSASDIRHFYSFPALTSGFTSLTVPALITVLVRLTGSFKELLNKNNQLLHSLHETNRVCYLRITLTGSSVVNAFVSRKIGKSETQGETWIRIGRIITVSFSSDAYVPFKTRLRHSQIAAEEPTSHTTSSVTIR